MDSGLGAVTFGLGAAVVWGAADFSGGFASRKTNEFGVVVASQWAGLIALGLLVLVFGEAPLSLTDMLWSGAAGFIGGGALVLLYRAMARGRMAIVAPVTAVMMAGVPVVFAALTEGLPAPLQVTGFGVALVGVWFVSRPVDGTPGRPDGLGLALVAGLLFGLFLILLDQLESNAVFWPFVFTRVTSSSVLTLIALRRHHNWSWLPRRRALPVVLLTGVLDVIGSVLYLLAAQSGRLDIAAVLSSLYPAGTVLLASALLKERLWPVQIAGVGAVLTAIVLIAA